MGIEDSCCASEMNHVDFCETQRPIYDNLQRNRHSMVSDVSERELLINEQLGDESNRNHNLLKKEPFLVCQRNCFIEDVKFLSFSQRRFRGFRNFYEFEQKRILIANENRIQILAYHPNDISKGVRLKTPTDDNFLEANDG